MKYMSECNDCCCHNCSQQDNCAMNGCDGGGCIPGDAEPKSDCDDWEPDMDW